VKEYNEIAGKMFIIILLLLSQYILKNKEGRSYISEMVEDIWVHAAIEAFDKHWILFRSM